jgi:hypothetical protein
LCDQDNKTKVSLITVLLGHARRQSHSTSASRWLACWLPGQHCLPELLLRNVRPTMLINKHAFNMQELFFLHDNTGIADIRFVDKLCTNQLMLTGRGEKDACWI